MTNVESNKVTKLHIELQVLSSVKELKKFNEVKYKVQFWNKNKKAHSFLVSRILEGVGIDLIESPKAKTEALGSLNLFYSQCLPKGVDSYLIYERLNQREIIINKDESPSHILNKWFEAMLGLDFFKLLSFFFNDVEFYYDKVEFVFSLKKDNAALDSNEGENERFSVLEGLSMRKVFEGIRQGALNVIENDENEGDIMEFYGTGYRGGKIKDYSSDEFNFDWTTYRYDPLTEEIVVKRYVQPGY